MAAGAALTVVALVAGGLFVVRNAAGAGPLTAGRVSDADLRILVAAARSCPMLTPARLAGQVMVASNFGDQPVPAMRTGGATGVAALTPEVWKKWAPWPDAHPADRSAGITALAHDMCQLAGQIRAVKVPGDPWPVTVAAYRGGMDAVVSAGGIPDGVQKYVDTVGRYASWYALQPQFGSATPATSTAVDTAVVVRVPDQYVKAVVAAGQVCAGMPPARIAAQIMATSGFDPRKFGSTGEQGIAQFRPKTWLADVPAAGSRTPWDAPAAIAALGKTMCALVGSAGDYATALAAFTHANSGEPVTALVAAVSRDEAAYAQDTRLKRSPATNPGQAAPAAGRPAPVPAGGTPPSHHASTSPPASSNQPPVKAAGRTSYGSYFIYNHATRECVDYVGNTGKPNGPVDQYPCAETGGDNQQFTFIPRATGSDGSQLYWIRNDTDGDCVDLPGVGPVGSSTSVQESDCFDNDNQYFRLQPRFTSGGFQFYWLRNTVAGDMCLDVPGTGNAGPKTVLAVVPCLKNDDHEWALVKKSQW